MATRIERASVAGVRIAARAAAVAARVAAVAALAAAMAAIACGGAPTAVQGEKRDTLCWRAGHPPPFVCPAGTYRRGKPPPEGKEMWCQRWDGTRQGPYRRFATGSAAGVKPPEFAGDGVVIGEYREGEQHGAWWTRHAGAGEVNVAYYDSGKLTQRVHCPP